MVREEFKQLPFPNFPKAADRSALRPIREWQGTGYMFPTFTLTTRVLHQGTPAHEMLEHIIKSAPYVRGIRVAEITTQDAPGEVNLRSTAIIPRNEVTAVDINRYATDMKHSKRKSTSYKALGILSLVDSDTDSLHIPMMLFKNGVNPDRLVKELSGIYPGYVTDVGGGNLQFWGLQLLPETKWKHFLDYVTHWVPGYLESFIKASRKNLLSVLVPFRSPNMNWIQPEVIRIVS